jgi:hypothetical protein
MSKAEDPKAPAEPAVARAEPAAREDVVFVHGPTESGAGFRVIRKREDAIEVGELRAIEEGRPVHGDVVRLRPRSEHGLLFDVEVLVEGPKAAGEPTRSGPAQVATDAYRTNWEAIFGQRQRQRGGEAPN